MPEPVDENDPFGLKRLENDPEFEASERARLTEIEQGDVPSKKIQEAFTEHINNFPQRRDPHSGVDFIIQPEKLFYSQMIPRDGSTLFQRRYYKHPSASEFSGDDIQVELLIHSEEDSYNARIDRSGEAPSFASTHSEYVSVHFIPSFVKSEADINFYEITINSKFEGRDLMIHYDGNGEAVLAIEFGLGRSSIGLYIPETDLKKLMESGKSTFHAGESTYQATYDKDAGQIKLVRSEGDDIKDVVIIPTSIDGREKFRDLFPEPLLADLHNADTELDKTWKDFNLDTFDIKWDRPTPNPKS